ncbi:hypothetical protein ACTXT7_017476 [Hymenolepis weldensis]
MKRHAVIVSIKAKHRNFEIARFLKVARSFLWKVRKELLNENNGAGLAATRKIKQEYCQRSADATVVVFGVVKSNEGHITTPPFLSQGLRVNADAGAYVETLLTAVVKPPWINSIANGGRSHIFQQDSTPSHKSHKGLDSQELSSSCDTKLMAS